MGFIQGLIGNANNVSLEKVRKEWDHLFAPGEIIGAAYRLVRDYIIFTDKRLIVIDVQGVTGAKIEVKSIPYNQITAFSIITPGVLELNADLKIWVASNPFVIEKKFTRDVNIYEVQALLAEATAFAAGGWIIASSLYISTFWLLFSVYITIFFKFC